MVRTEVVDDEEAVGAPAGGLPEGLAVGVAADGGEEPHGALAEEVARVGDGVAEAVDRVHGARGRRRLHECLEQQQQQAPQNWAGELAVASFYGRHGHGNDLATNWRS